ncbi:pimeloyl-ACP methyl ester carboxylesterase [Spirosoma lacussanchae]|uniref:alpha/beta fold hydrolase n=1 Tax=Spirosoma lacussanchae TaxID=1884249 RepID=UPI0011090854|nr:alpha/beta fold hydrolase [Spirosoma lacussanchae]
MTYPLLPYTTLGQGQPLVLLHGLGGNRHQWISLLEPIPGYQLLVPDLPGHGDASWLPTAPCSFDSFAQAVADWLDLLTQEGQITGPIVLGGISMGAGIAIRYALNRPDQIRNLVLLRPAWVDQPLPSSLSILYRLGKRLESDHDTLATQTWLLQDELFLTLQTENPACAASIMGQLNRPDPPLTARTLVEIVNSAPIQDWAEVMRLALPTLVMGSTDDPLHPMAMATSWANALPNASFREVASRYTEPDQHTADVNRCMFEFLTVGNRGN